MRNARFAHFPGPIWAGIVPAGRPTGRSSAAKLRRSPSGSSSNRAGNLSRKEARCQNLKISVFIQSLAVNEPSVRMGAAWDLWWHLRPNLVVRGCSATSPSDDLPTQPYQRSSLPLPAAMGVRIVRELIRRPRVRSLSTFDVLKGITFGENFKEKTLTDTSKFVMAWRFDLYPKVFVKGFERLPQKCQAITNLLVSVNVFPLIFEVFVDLQLQWQCCVFFFLNKKTKAFFGWEEP